MICGVVADRRHPPSDGFGVAAQRIVSAEVRDEVGVVTWTEHHCRPDIFTCEPVEHHFRHLDEREPADGRVQPSRQTTSDTRCGTVTVPAQLSDDLVYQSRLAKLLG